MDDHAESVLRLVGEAGYTPLRLKAMARRLEVATEDHAAFRAAVKDLIRAGRIELGRDKTLRPPDRKGLVVGVFRRASRGFGFVKPEPPHHARGSIYIPPPAARDAATGDTVAVRITKRARRPGENDEGQVVRVESRAAGSFVGVYHEQGGEGFVQIDGTTFREPIPVGDPGAKGATPNDKVVVEIVQYPTASRAGEAVIVEILGQRGLPGVDAMAVIRSFNIPDVFDPSVLEQAREQARLFSEDDLLGRLDLRSLPTITIDPATARDFDDAISLSRDEKGFFNLAVHIADVAHFVPAGSAIDHAARDRGTSVYLPDLVIPMLPELISNGLASLQADHTRYTVSAMMEFTPDGIPTDRRFARSAIKVDHRFSYEQAMAHLREPTAGAGELAPGLLEMLHQMHELAMILRARRFTRGALELSLPEVQIELDPTGGVAGARLATHDESHQLIEEFMLAANEAVASRLSEAGVVFPRRVHPNPDPFKLEDFAEFVQGLGLTLDQPQSRFELQRVLKETQGRPEEYAVHFGLLRSLKQAQYTPLPEGHYALASDNYCHFTSPIRRYPDLVVHRQLLAWLLGQTPRIKIDEMVSLCQHCTRTERRAQAAERELVRVKLLTHLQSRINESFHAIITGVEEFGLFCRLIELPVDGLIPIASLPDDFYYLEAGSLTLIGRRSGARYRLGDAPRVRIAKVDVDRRQLDLVLDEPEPRPRGLSPARRQPAAESPSRRPPRLPISPKKPKAKQKPSGRKPKKTRKRR